MSQLIRLMLGGALAVAVATPVRAGTPALYVSMLGTDSPTCGTQRDPCRTISQAVARATDGSTVVVGPGRYGDLNADGVLRGGGALAEEDPVPCGSASCAVRISKPIALVSSDGPGATVIDAGERLLTGVLITSNDARLGREKQGFTIAGAKAEAVLVRGGATHVEGNVVSGNRALGVVLDLGVASIVHRNTIAGNGDFGVFVKPDAGGAVVSENHVAGNGYAGSGGGLEIVAAATIVGNVVSANEGPGIRLSANDVRIEGNQISGNLGRGIELAGSNAVIARNAVTGNRESGVHLDPAATAEVTANDIFGNDPAGNCGLVNASGGPIDATEGYWGAPDGPGARPADRACDVVAGAVTTVAPVRPTSIGLKLEVGR